MFEKSCFEPAGLGAVRGGRLKQAGRRQRRQFSLEHVFDLM